MCDQTEIRYLDGEVVWVKLGPCWWPGQVISVDNLPEDLKDDYIKKPPIAAVKFFQENSYEFVKNLHQIYKYNCTQKDDFIKKGLDKHRTKRRDGSTLMDKFPGDVSTAETLTGGDPDILLQEKFASPSKLDISGLFGEKKSPKKKQKAKDAEMTRRSYGSPNRKIIHPRFIRESDHEIRIRQQPIQSSPAPPMASQFSCSLCNFTTTRVNVLICHTKIHRDSPVEPTRSRPSLPAPKRRSVGQDSQKRKYVRKNKSLPRLKTSEPVKRKLVKHTNKVSKKKKSDPEITDLLADWDDGSDEDMSIDVSKSTENLPDLPDEETEPVSNVVRESLDNELLENSEKLLQETEIFSRENAKESSPKPEIQSEIQSDSKPAAELATEPEIKPDEKLESKADGKSDQESKPEVPPKKKSVLSKKFKKSFEHKPSTPEIDEEKKSKFSCFDFEEDDPEPAIPPVRKIPRVFGEKNTSLKKELIKEFVLSQALANERETEGKSTADNDVKGKKNLCDEKNAEVLPKTEGYTSVKKRGSKHTAKEGISKNESSMPIEKEEIVKNDSSKIEKKGIGKKDDVKSMGEDEVVENDRREETEREVMRKKESLEDDKLTREIMKTVSEASDLVAKIAEETEKSNEGIEKKDIVETVEIVEILEVEKEAAPEDDGKIEAELEKMELDTPVVSDIVDNHKIITSPKKSPAKSPINSPNRSPRKSPGKSPMHSPLRSPGKSLEKLSEKSREKSPEKLREKSREKSPEKSREKSLEKHSRKSRGKIRGNSREKSVEKLNQKSSEKEKEKIREKSQEKLRRKSRGKSAEKSPEKSRGKTPEKTRGKTPEKTRGKSPEKSRGRSPDKSRGKTPEKSSGKSRDKSPKKSPKKSTSPSPFSMKLSPLPKELDNSKISDISGRTMIESEEETLTITQIETGDGAVSNLAWNQIVAEKSSAKALSKDLVEKVETPVAQTVEKPVKRRGRPRKSIVTDVSGNGEPAKFEEPHLPGTPDSQEMERKTESDGERSYTGRKRKPNKRYLESDIYTSSPGRRTPRTDDSQSETEERPKDDTKKGRRGRKPSVLKQTLRKSLEDYELPETTVDSPEEAPASILTPKSPTKCSEQLSSRPEEIAPVNITDLLATTDVEIRAAPQSPKIESESTPNISLEPTPEEKMSKIFENIDTIEKPEEKKIDMLPPKKSQIKKFEMSQIDLQMEKPGENEKLDLTILEEKKILLTEPIVESGLESISEIAQEETVEISTVEVVSETIVEETIENIIEEVIPKEDIMEGIETVEKVVELPVEANQVQCEMPESLEQIVEEIVKGQELEEEIEVPKTDEIVAEKIDDMQEKMDPMNDKIVEPPPKVEEIPQEEIQKIDTSIPKIVEKIEVPKIDEPIEDKSELPACASPSSDTKVPVKKREKPRIIENVALREPMQILKSKLLEKQPSKGTKHKLEDSPKAEASSRSKILKLDSPGHQEKLTITQKLQVLKAEKLELNSEKVGLSNTISISSGPSNSSDIEYDINSIPFVLSEDLNPDNIEQMPVMMSPIIPSTMSTISTISTVALSSPTTNQANAGPNQTQFKGQIEHIDKTPTKKKTPTILKSKTKAKPTITSIQKLMPPLTGGLKALKFPGQSQKQMPVLTSPKGSPGKYVIVQAGTGQHIRYSVRKNAVTQTMAIPGKAGNPQIVQQGGKVVILTSPQSGQSKVLPLGVQKTVTTGKVQKIVKGGQLIGQVGTKTTVIAPKTDGASPTTSKMVTTSQKILNTGVLGSKGVLTSISGGKGLMGTIPQHFVGKGGVITQINTSQLAGKSVVGQKTFVSSKGTFYTPISSPGGTKTVLAPLSQTTLGGKTIITSAGLVPGKGAVLTPFTGQQVKAMAAKSPGKAQLGTGKVQYQSQKIQLPLLQKKVSISGSPGQRAKPSGTILLQNPPPLHQTTPGKISSPKKIIRQNLTTIVSPQDQVQAQLQRAKSLTTPQKMRQTKQKIVIQKQVESPKKLESPKVATVAKVPVQKSTSMSIGTQAASPWFKRGQDTMKNVQKQVPVPPLVPTPVVQATAEVPVVEQKPEPVLDVKIDTSSSTTEAPKPEEKPAPQAQIMALPTESADGSQTYVLVTIDEQGQIQPLDNNALMSLEGTTANADGSRTLYIDPTSLDPSGAIDNIVLQFDNSQIPPAPVPEPQTVAESFTPNRVHTSSQDILAAALANTDFQQEILPETTSVVTGGLTPTNLDTQTILQSTLIPSTEPISSPSVLETSLTLNQPIMTPLEVPSNLGIQQDIAEAPISSISTVPISINSNISTISDISNISNIPNISNITSVPSIANVSDISMNSNIPSIENLPNVSYISEISSSETVPGNSMPDIGDLMGTESTEIVQQPGEQFLVVRETGENESGTISYEVVSGSAGEPGVQTTPSMPIIDDSFGENTFSSTQHPSDELDSVSSVPEVVRDMPIVPEDVTDSAEKLDEKSGTSISNNLGMSSREEAPEIALADVHLDHSAGPELPKIPDSMGVLDEPMETEDIEVPEVSQIPETSTLSHNDLPQIPMDPIEPMEIDEKIEPEIKNADAVDQKPEIETTDTVDAAIPMKPDPREMESINPIETDPIRSPESHLINATESDRINPIETEQTDPIELEPMEPIETTSISTIEMGPINRTETDPIIALETESMNPIEADPINPINLIGTSNPMETEPDPMNAIEPTERDSMNPMDTPDPIDPIDPIESPSQSFKNFSSLSINDEVISQSTSKSPEICQSICYSEGTREATQSFEDANTSVSQSYESTVENTNAISQSFRESQVPDGIDDPSFPTQSYEVGKMDNLESLRTDEISQEGNIPSQSNDVGNEGIGTSGFPNSVHSEINEDETASSSYVPETPEAFQERDQDQESAISTSSYEIPPCDEINIASSSVNPDTSVDVGQDHDHVHEHEHGHDNGVPEIPTSSYTLNPDSSMEAPTSSFEDQVIVEQNVSTSYEAPISMPRLEEGSQNFVSESSDQRNEPSSYYAQPEEATSEPTQSYFIPEGPSPSYSAPRETEASQSFYQEIDRTSSRSVEPSPSFYQETEDPRLRSQGEATPTYERYPLDYTVENSPIDRHDLVESSVPAKPTDR